MTTRRQESAYRCECGQLAPVERITAHEFHAYCPHCGRCTVLSWFHGSPPPLFEGDQSPRLPMRLDQP